MVRRFVTIALAALVLFGNVAAIECEGWQTSASDRMACCAKAQHPCSDQLSADQCCGASELAKQPTEAGSTTASPPLAATAVPTFLAALWIAPPVALFVDPPQSLPHLRQTVLLI
jgi:hypothetical protein